MKVFKILKIVGILIIVLIILYIIQGCSFSEESEIRRAISSFNTVLETSPDIPTPDTIRYWVVLELQIREVTVDWQNYLNMMDELGDDPDPEEVIAVMQVFEDKGEGPFNDNYISRRTITIEVGEKVFQQYYSGRHFFTSDTEEIFRPSLDRMSVMTEIKVRSTYMTDMDGHLIEIGKDGE